MALADACALKEFNHGAGEVLRRDGLRHGGPPEADQARAGALLPGRGAWRTAAWWAGRRPAAPAA